MQRTDTTPRRGLQHPHLGRAQRDGGAGAKARTGALARRRVEARGQFDGENAGAACVERFDDLGDRTARGTRRAEAQERVDVQVGGGERPRPGPDLDPARDCRGQLAGAQPGDLVGLVGGHDAHVRAPAGQTPRGHQAVAAVVSLAC